MDADRSSAVPDAQQLTRILVADDDPAMRAFFRDALAGDRFTVDLFEDGDEALEAFMSEGFSLLILDMMMPRLSGLEVIRRLRGSGVRVPIILTTGDLGGQALPVSAHYERIVILPKPFGRYELNGALEAAQVIPVPPRSAPAVMRDGPAPDPRLHRRPPTRFGLSLSALLG